MRREHEDEHAHAHNPARMHDMTPRYTAVHTHTPRLGNGAASLYQNYKSTTTTSLGHISHLGGISAASRPRLVNGFAGLRVVFVLLSLRAGGAASVAQSAGQSHTISARSRHDLAATPHDLGTISLRLGTVSLRSRRGLAAISARSWRDHACSICPTPSPERPSSESSGAAEDEAEPGDCPAAPCQSHKQQTGMGARDADAAAAHVHTHASCASACVCMYARARNSQIPDG